VRIAHAHTGVIAVGCHEDGFVAVCQEGCALGPVPSLGFSGILTALEERKCIADAFGNHNAVLLRNHGFAVIGSSIPDAILKTFYFVYNIQAQLHLASSKKLILPSAAAAQRTYDQLRQGEVTEKLRPNVSTGQVESFQWGPGEMDWEANMRLLDSMGLKTGHEYRLPVWRGAK